MNGDDLSPQDKQELKISLRSHFEALLREHEKMHSQLAENVRVAFDVQDKRLEGMNEFRRSLEDFQSRAVSRELFDQQQSAFEERLRLFENFRSKALGVGAMLALISGVIGAAILKAFGG